MFSYRTVIQGLGNWSGRIGRCLLGALIVATYAVICVVPLAQAQTTAAQLRREMGGERFDAAGLHRLSEEELHHLRLFLLEVAASDATPTRAEGVGGVVRQQPTQQVQDLDIDDLEGGSIVAEDGTFLGCIDRNRLGEKSLSNRIGAYGSRISNESIRNKIGPYGSKISDQSPFNRIASDPPKVFDRAGKFVGYLTINKMIHPRIDPNMLLGWVSRE